MVPSAINLSNHPNLRVLKFEFGPGSRENSEEWDSEIRWFTSICESIQSKSLVIAVSGLYEEMERCNNMIHDVL